MVFSATPHKVDCMGFFRFHRMVKAKQILIYPTVLLTMLEYVFENSGKEVVALLGGRVEGKYLIVSEIFTCKNSPGTKTNVKINTEEMTAAQKNFTTGNYTIGWAHSHLGYGVFMSATDIATQIDFQALFSDSVALVVDPFLKGIMSFGFFRVMNNKAYEMDYQYLVKEDETKIFRDDKGIIPGTYF